MFYPGQNADGGNEEEEATDSDTLEGEEHKDDKHGHHDAHLEHDGDDGEQETASGEPERSGLCEQDKRQGEEC